MENEIHEKILLFLFEHRNNDEVYDLYKQFSGVDQNIIAKRTRELQKQGFISLEFPFGGATVFLMKTGEVKGSMPPSGHFIKARILTPGIDYVKKELLKKDSFASQKEHPVKKGWMKEIILGVIIVILGALLLKLFGIA